MTARKQRLDVTPTAEVAFNPFFLCPAPFAMGELVTLSTPPTSRGSLSRLVEGLILNTSLSYAAIVAEAQKEYPTCLTSTKSVASVAAALKRSGKVFPSRMPARVI